MSSAATARRYRLWPVPATGSDPKRKRWPSAPAGDCTGSLSSSNRRVIAFQSLRRCEQNSDMVASPEHVKCEGRCRGTADGASGNVRRRHRDRPVSQGCSRVADDRRLHIKANRVFEPDQAPFPRESGHMGGAGWHRRIDPRCRALTKMNLLRGGLHKCQHHGYPPLNLFRHCRSSRSRAALGP